MKTKRLMEVRRETYGHDARATSRQSERWYRDAGGCLYAPSGALDGCPPFFEAYGPFGEEHHGVLPRLRLSAREFWGDEWSGAGAETAFPRELDAQIETRNRKVRWNHEAGV